MPQPSWTGSLYNMGRAYDVAVLGGTPAGYVAALCIAKARKDVVVMDAPQQGSECPLCDWAPAGTMRIKGLPKALAASWGANRSAGTSLPACSARAGGPSPFSTVVYHDVKLERTAQYRSSKPAGVFVSFTDLRDRLRRDAEQAGVRLIATKTPPAIELLEDHVRLVNTSQVAARLLLIAQGSPAEAMANLAMSARSAAPTQLAAAGLDVPVGRKDAARLAGALHVVEMPERTELGVFFALGQTVHIRVISHSLAAGARAEELSGLVGKLQEAGLLPGKMQLGRAKGAVWHPPAGAALELERHVAKRCLLLGTAGGFAESVAGGTIRATIESAVIAAQTALDALARPDTQEALGGFRTAWRKRQAAYLGPPSTSLHLLLPLLFVNKTIVARFTRALLYGEAI